MESVLYDTAPLKNSIQTFVQKYITADFFIILIGASVTIISAIALVNTRFLKKLIRWQFGDRGYEMETTTMHIVLGKLGALIGVIGGIISLIIGFGSP